MDTVDNSVHTAVVLDSYNQCVAERKVKTLSNTEFEYVVQRLGMGGWCRSRVMGPEETSSATSWTLTHSRSGCIGITCMRPDEPRAEVAEAD